MQLQGQAQPWQLGGVLPWVLVDWQELLTQQASQQPANSVQAVIYESTVALICAKSMLLGGSGAAVC